jgi:hypothetical protein
MTDFSRDGTLLEIKDPSKETSFLGRSEKLPKETYTDYLKYHEDAIDGFFSQEELPWKRAVQAAVTQTALNKLLEPVAVGTMLLTENNAVALTNASSRRIEVQIIRNPQTKTIEKALVTVSAVTPVALSPEGGNYPMKSDPIGHFTSTMTFSVSPGEGNFPQVSDEPLDKPLYSHKYGSEAPPPE